jgi:hypothetical protein
VFATQAEDTVMAVSNSAAMNANILVISRLLSSSSQGKVRPSAPSGRFHFG